MTVIFYVAGYSEDSKLSNGHHVKKLVRGNLYEQFNTTKSPQCMSYVACAR